MPRIADCDKPNWAYICPMKHLGHLPLILFLVFASAVVLLTLWGSSRHAHELAAQERDKMYLWAEATRRMASQGQNTSQDYTYFLEVIMRNDNLPVILADDRGQPISLRNVPGANRISQEQVSELIATYAQQHPPITVELPSGQRHYIYYGDSQTLYELRFFPYIQLLMICVLVGLGYYALHQAKIGEQNRLWVGLAKETAHQLGTPISSLVAWHQLLEEEDQLQEFTESLALDIQRLERVADRFSKIGATPQLLDTDIAQTIRDSASYMRPRISHRIALNVSPPEQDEPIRHNAVLIQWVLENLIRNAVDAIEAEGQIDLTARCSGQSLVIDCRDTGRGIPRHKRRNIFSAGYTTKTRGWGLGLSLAKRIVREYHHGSIGILSSEVGKGTTIRIVLPRSPGSEPTSALQRYTTGRQKPHPPSTQNDTQHDRTS
ncbi:MAG: hypothetical protein CSA97_05765 [Bacteroidetes bacterium]|nr:MAG: hypothetical protein CSA97_05765 [Bacteroidota bacterium]